MISKANIISKPSSTTIFLDGVRIDGVTRFSISQEVGQEVPRLVIETACEVIRVDAEVEHEEPVSE